MLLQCDVLDAGEEQDSEDGEAYQGLLHGELAFLNLLSGALGGLSVDHSVGLGPKVDLAEEGGEKQTEGCDLEQPAKVDHAGDLVSEPREDADVVGKLGELGETNKGASEHDSGISAASLFLLNSVNLLKVYGRLQHHRLVAFRWLP